jgi:single-strand DNA-binding protein
MNTIIITGRLTADPQYATTQSGVERCKFSVAIPRPKKKDGTEQPPTYVDCVAWRQLAQFIGQHWQKGKPIEIVGSLQIEDYVDREGNRRKQTYIQVEHASFTLSDKGESGGAAPRTNGTTSIAPAPAPDDDMLPF